jgi:GGDEF-like domain/PucR C-terminal helix-turn-helix domain
VTPSTAKELPRRLRERKAEIAQATLTRINAVAGSSVDDPEYLLGLREAVEKGLEYAIGELETEHSFEAPVPDQLLAQARAAARHEVSLDTVLRRYSVGYTLLGDFLIEEASAAGLEGEALKTALRANAVVFDRLIAAVSAEYAREAGRRAWTAEERRVELVRKLLAADHVCAGELRYALSHWHLAALAQGPDAGEAIRGLARAADRQLLLVEVEGMVWCWLGGARELPAQEFLRRAEQCLPVDLTLAIGEPGHGVEGWRLSHRQAKAAMAVARRGGEAKVLYADVALVASALCDDTLASSLREIYLAPLETERDGGAVLRETLHAYFATGRNVSSAAAILGVNRQTVSVRLRIAEEKIGRPVDRCNAEAEVALRLSELNEIRSISPVGRVGKLRERRGGRGAETPE